MSAAHESGRLPSAEVVGYLRAHPGAGRQQVMRACGTSADEVRWAERWLEKDRVLRARRRRRAIGLGLAGLVLAGVAGVVVVVIQRERAQRAAVEASERARVARETERALYGALDRRDPAHRTEAGEQLASEDPAVRLAALRYLAGVDPTGQAEALLAALDDPAPRVRTAALSLVARSLPLARCGGALVRVVRDEARPLAERQLALSGLGAARQVDRALARELVPLFGSGPAQLHRELEITLATLAGVPPTRAEGPFDPEAAAARWRSVLGERS